jgi:hypothetical protein
MLTPQITQYLTLLGNLPNAPYLPMPVVDEIERAVSRMATQRPSHIEVYKNHLGLFVRVKQTQGSTRPILVSTHIDHPLFVTGADNSATAFGSISVAQICDSLGKPNWQIPVAVWDRRGGCLGDAILAADRGKRWARVLASFKVPPNCHLMWRLPLEMSGSYVSLVAADNLLHCAICLSIIEGLLRHEDASFDVTFMFGAIEEVKQLSATGVVLEGMPTLGKIDSNWCVLVLEVGSATLGDQLAATASKLGLREPSSKGGPALRISDEHMVHGQEGQSANLAEWVLIRSAKELGIHYQHSVSGGMCDASVFTAFNVTPNIAGIALANENRHNLGRSDAPVYEQVSVDDINDAARWLELAILSAGQCTQEEVDTSNLLTSRLKHTELAASKNLLAAIRRDRQRTYEAMKPRMQRGYYFPENLHDRLSSWYAIGRAFLSRNNTF